MALLARPRCYWRFGAAAQESIDEVAEAQQILQGADQLRNLRCAAGIPKIGPIGGDQRLTAVRQKEHQLQAGWHAHLSKDLQSSSFEWVMWTRDGDAFGKVLRMGSVSWFPSTRFHMTCFSGWWNGGLETFRYYA